MRKLFVSITLCCIGVAAHAQDRKPDLILFNGKLFTSVEAHPYVQAIAIRGERILATGDDTTIRALAGAQTRQIDLHGATAIPGINDAHHHFQLEPPEFDVDLKTIDPTWSQVKDGVAEAIVKAPAGQLISVTIGRTIFHDPSITRDTLDQLAPHNPVSLNTFTGHAMVLNSAALRLYKVAEDQPDPLGGRYERDAKGRLTGVVREYAILNLERAAADAVPAAAAVDQLREQLNEEAKYGVTSIQELSFSMAPARAVSLLEEVPIGLRVRIVRMPGTTTAGRNTAEGKGVPVHPANLLTVSGSKWLADGVPIEGTFTPRGALKPISQPPLDAAVHDLPLTFPQPEYAAMLRESLKDNDQLLFHVSGYLSAKAILDAMDASGGKAVWATRRVCFEHGDGLFPDLLPRIREYGIVVVQNPLHLMGVAHPGVEMFEKAQPLKSLLVDGIPLAFGSDGQTNPYLDIMFATLHGDRPSQAITREQAVIAYTRTAAYAEFEEKEKGTLEPGKLADLAVLSQDIFTVPTPELPKTVSAMTIVGGKIVYSK